MKPTEAQKLRKVRLYLNLTQKELGKRINLSASTISSYENERRGVSARVRKWVNKMYRKHQLSKKVIKSARDRTLCAFMPQRCYSINDDDRIFHRSISSLTLGYVFRYERMEGIHHCFREVRGGWSRTYTDWQLVDKRVLEVSYLSMAG